MKYHEAPSCGAEFFHADRRRERESKRKERERERDVLKLMVAFRNFGNAPQNDVLLWRYDIESKIIPNCEIKLEWFQIIADCLWLQSGGDRFEPGDKSSVSIISWGNHSAAWLLLASQQIVGNVLHKAIVYSMGRNRSVGIATCYGLDCPGIDSR
jgi:hypothetical protein